MNDSLLCTGDRHKTLRQRHPQGVVSYKPTPRYEGIISDFYLYKQLLESI